MKKLFTLLLAIVASVGIMFAESGTCGENLTWDLTNGVLSISGTGAMMNFSSSNDIPWYSLRDNIISVVINQGITHIGGGAFDNCRNLTSVSIPNSVTNIKEAAFSICTGLTSITCEAVIPPTLGAYVFYEVNKSIPLYVPAESVEAYQTANQWKDFMNIQAIGTEDINQISQEPRINSQKLIKDGQILILRGDKVYTITGQEVR